MTHNEVEEQRMMLDQAGATNISNYIEKLTGNYTNRDVFGDLLFEGRAALMFLINGFLVDMRESPDLSIQFATHQFYADIKHFRLKEQDVLDQANMETTQDELVSYGDTVLLEDVAAWDQVVQVAKRKIKQYRENASNILVIGSSSSHCIDDAIIPTAINIIAEEISKSNCTELNKLNGILLISTSQVPIHRAQVFVPGHRAHEASCCFP